MDRLQDKEGDVMIPDRCTFCHGTLKEGKSQFIARVGDEVIVIRDVPAFVCEQCQEAHYRADISEKIDEVMKDAHSGKLCARPLAAGGIERKV
jgi:YgiT-type zinc finger domain-containing protein